MTCNASDKHKDFSISIKHADKNGLNNGADFWRYKIGVNVIPANTREKKPLKGVSWDIWQDNPIPEEIHNQWKEQGTFSQGIAIIPGKVWHRQDKNGLYFTFLDADKSNAINENFLALIDIGIECIMLRNKRFSL